MSRFRTLLRQQSVACSSSPPPSVDGVFAAGQTPAISTNTPLFALLGTRYGGNGATTFRLPDLRDLASRGTAYAICTEGSSPAVVEHHPDREASALRGGWASS
jgi:microcystin-dependent protein